MAKIVVGDRLLMIPRLMIVRRNHRHARARRRKGGNVVNDALAQRNAQIRAMVMRMMAEKSLQGRQKYTSGYIYDKVAVAHGLKPRTVKNIFWNSGVYSPPVSPVQNVDSQA